MSRSYLKTSASVTKKKKTASRKRGGAEFLDQNGLVSDLERLVRFQLDRFLSAASVEAAAARRAGAKRVRPMSGWYAILLMSPGHIR